MTLSLQDRLEAELNVLPDDLGLTQAQYDARMDIWESLAAERTGVTGAQRYEHAKALLLRSWVVVLLRKADEFEAVGEMKRKTDILGRVARLEAWGAVALRNAGLLEEEVGFVSANPAPVIGGWGVDDGG